MRALLLSRSKAAIFFADSINFLALSRLVTGAFVRTRGIFFFGGGERGSDDIKKENYDVFKRKTENLFFLLKCTKK